MNSDILPSSLYASTLGLLLFKYGSNGQLSIPLSLMDELGGKRIELRTYTDLEMKEIIVKVRIADGTSK